MSLTRIAVVAVLLSAAPAWAQDKLALSQAEIDDMHSCVGANQVMLCTGEKRLLTGISINPDMTGARISNVAAPRSKWLGPSADLEWLVTVSLMGHEPEAPYKRNFYVIDDDGLRKIIAKARQDLEWKPSAP